MKKSGTSRKLKMIGFKPNANDQRAIAALQARFGGLNKASVIRMAVHRMAEAEGLSQVKQAGAA